MVVLRVDEDVARQISDNDLLLLSKVGQRGSPHIHTSRGAALLQGADPVVNLTHTAFATTSPHPPTPPPHQPHQPPPRRTSPPPTARAASST
jgi:hypothetical protein